MDIFNKKKIKFLEGEIGELWYNLAQKEKTLRELEKPKCFDVGDSLPGNSVLGAVCRTVRALEEYLEVKIKWEWEDDPTYPPPQPQRRRVWRAYKERRNEKNKIRKSNKPSRY